MIKPRRIAAWVIISIPIIAMLFLIFTALSWKELIGAVLVTLSIISITWALGELGIVQTHYIDDWDPPPKNNKK